MSEVAQVSGRGTITLPASLRKQLGLTEGDVLTVRIQDGSIVLTPAVVTEVELYTDGRLREFEGSSQMSEADLRRARRAWKLPRPAE